MEGRNDSVILSLIMFSTDEPSRHITSQTVYTHDVRALGQQSHMTNTSGCCDVATGVHVQHRPRLPGRVGAWAPLGHTGPNGLP